LLLSSCIFGNSAISEVFRETRTELIRTNLIGIVGETSSEPYIEIQYSVPDETNSRYNRTESLWISPPYIFKNDSVYMTYEYVEYVDYKTGTFLGYRKTLLRNFNKGGAEYLRIINHSPDKSVEFFIAGAPPTGDPTLFPSITPIPFVQYRRAPIYFLLYPECNTWSFGTNHIGDLVVTEAWSIDEVIALYREEYARSEITQLKIADDDYRMIDMINGIDTHRAYKDAVFYGTIKPKEELRGNDRMWLLATIPIFNNEFEYTLR
jgi:hypothetical protein